MKYIIFHSMVNGSMYRYMVYKDTTFITWITTEEPRDDAVDPPEGVDLDPPPPLPK